MPSQDLEFLDALAYAMADELSKKDFTTSGSAFTNNAFEWYMNQHSPVTAVAQLRKMFEFAAVLDLTVQTILGRGAHH